MNVDFEDVKTVMSEPAKAMMATAVAGGPDRANEAAELAAACRLFEGIDLSGAGGVLVLIAASKATVKLSKSPPFAKAAMTTVRRFAADHAHVIFGTADDESLSDQLRVTVIATGLSSAACKSEQRNDGRNDGRNSAPLSVVQQPQHALRTGTDNLPSLNHQLGAQPHMAGTPQTHSDDGLNTPSVWRSARSQAAAKVDALSSNGMDEIEIPAFLRQQAD